jgi:hypothetical protein
LKVNGRVKKTVMCEGIGRIEYFSNPDIDYDKVSTGVPIGKPNEAHNAKVMADSAPFVADFRK